MREVPARVIWRCGVLVGLVVLQGVVGWWMVASGLVNRVEVAQERLATHLLLASLTFAALVWLAVGLRRGAREEATGLGAKIMGWLLALVTLNTGRLTIPAGCAALGKWCLNLCRQWANRRK